MSEYCDKLSGIERALFDTLVDLFDVEKESERVREHFVHKLMDHWYVGRKEAEKVIDMALKKVMPCVREERKARGLK